jgi:hypothetical protein
VARPPRRNDRSAALRTCTQGGSGIGEGAQRGGEEEGEEGGEVNRAHQLVAATTHHEAGHIVSAWRQGIKFKFATIVPTDTKGSLGSVETKLPKWFNPKLESSLRITAKATADIIVSLAGQIAERKYLGTRPRWGMGHDNYCAVTMASHLCGSTRQTKLISTIAGV